MKLLVVLALLAIVLLSACTFSNNAAETQTEPKQKTLADVQWSDCLINDFNHGSANWTPGDTLAVDTRTVRIESSKNDNPSSSNLSALMLFRSQNITRLNELEQLITLEILKADSIKNALPPPRICTEKDYTDAQQQYTILNSSNIGTFEPLELCAKISRFEFLELSIKSLSELDWEYYHSDYPYSLYDFFLRFNDKENGSIQARSWTEESEANALFRTLVKSDLSEYANTSPFIERAYDKNWFTSGNSMVVRINYSENLTNEEKDRILNDTINHLKSKWYTENAYNDAKGCFT